MGPAQAISTGFHRSFQLSGRASRPEFWWFAPVAAIAAWAIFVAVMVVADFLRLRRANEVNVTLLLLLHVPIATALIRRLRDTGLRWHLLRILVQIAVACCVSLVGYFFWALFALTNHPSQQASNIASGVLVVVTASPLIIALLRPSTASPNRYGPNPLEVRT